MRERAREKWEWKLSAKAVEGQRRERNEREEKTATSKRDRWEVRKKEESGRDIKV